MANIRLATTHDAAGILEIYAPYIENTSFTFETEVPSLEDFQKRISDYLINWPWVVCEIDGVITGYAYGAKYRERTAYQWCVESSIYIHDDFLKHKIGKALYEALIEILKRQGYRNIYAVINLPNDRSVKFHESCGFTYFATYEKVGYKLGKWKNVGWWQLSINEYGMDPLAPIKFSELKKDFLQDLFEEKSKMIRS
ncbi:MAG: N-acetyltransferase family protein [Bacteroidetes bacterium]|nr:MAG: N-acetyltransferase family protein [Bacteroidota bacterium]